MLGRSESLRQSGVLGRSEPGSAWNASGADWSGSFSGSAWAGRPYTRGCGADVLAGRMAWSAGGITRLARGTEALAVARAAAPPADPASDTGTAARPAPASGEVRGAGTMAPAAGASSARPHPAGSASYCAAASGVSRSAYAGCSGIGGYWAGGA